VVNLAVNGVLTVGPGRPDDDAMTDRDGQHRHHRDAAVLSTHRRVLTAAAYGDADEVVAALGHLRELREALDRTEHELLVLARRRGVSWARAAAHLGLRSRQAAEQRAARLAAGAAAHGGPDVCGPDTCPHCVDAAPIAELRAAVRAAWRQLAADPAWDGADPRAALTRASLAAAADAPAGSLYALAGHAVDDLARVPLDQRPVLLRVAVTRLREAFESATPPRAAGAVRRPVAAPSSRG
jgi:hypothetical protein